MTKHQGYQKFKNRIMHSENNSLIQPIRTMLKISRGRIVTQFLLLRRHRTTNDVTGPRSSWMDYWWIGCRASGIGWLHVDCNRTARWLWKTRGGRSGKWPFTATERFWGFWLLFFRCWLPQRVILWENWMDFPLKGSAFFDVFSDEG